MGRQIKRKNISRPENNAGLSPAGPEDFSPLTAVDIKTLVRDLRGLAAQVEVLKKARVELEQSRDKYRELYDTVPAGHFTIDEKHTILEANAIAAKILGAPRSTLQGTKFTRFLIPDRQSIDIFYSHVRKVLKTGRGQQCALEMRRSDGKRFYGALASLPADPGAIGANINIALTDVTLHRRSELEIQQSEEKYRHLFETTSQGVIYQDASGRVLSANAAALQILGLTLEQLQARGGSNIHGKAVHEDGSEFSDDEHPSAIAISQCDDVKDVIMGFFNQTQGTYCWASVCATPQFRPGEIRPFQTYITLNDITRRKRAEEALVRARDELEERVRERTRELAESEEKYRKVVENASEAIFVSQDQRSKLFNPKALELFGYSREELMAKPLFDLIHPDDLDMVEEQYRKRAAGEQALSGYEHRIVCKDGSIKWVAVNAVLISWENRPASLVLLTDITSHREMEQELKVYARRITQVQEEERKRIAYELHDDTAQYLAILKLQLDSLVHSGKIQDPEVLEKLTYLEKDASRAVDDVRRYSHELRPGVLEHLGLQAALEQIAGDINKFNQIVIDVNVEGVEPELSEEVKLGFFRIAQEAINNCRKHSKAGNAEVNIEFDRKRMMMAISDNGNGFDVRQAIARTSQTGSLGLMSMQERAKLIGATLKIESAPGKGTVIFVELKL